MGQIICKNSNLYSSDILEAFEERFIKQKTITDPNKYVSLYLFAYELAHFFRNDKIQIVVEETIKNLSHRISPTPDDWLVFTLNFIYYLIQTKRLTRYGHDNYPVIVGYDLINK